jgi:hypothetical protein
VLGIDEFGQTTSIEVYLSLNIIQRIDINIQKRFLTMHVMKKRKKCVFVIFFKRPIELTNVCEQT